MTTPGTALTYRQLAVIDRNANVSEADIKTLEQNGIKVIQVEGEPHRVFMSMHVPNAASVTNG